MLLKLDIRDETAVRLFSEQLVDMRESLSVEIDEVDFCPNRIVPVVALADLSCRVGGKIGFRCPRGTAAEVATAGFSTSRMNPDPQIDAEYLYDPSRNLENARESWSIAGYEGTTTVDFQIKCDGELSFADVFPEAAGLTDFWAENRESSDGRVVVKISEVVNNCGSRSAGREMRTLVENLIEADGRRVVIDFCGMENCSSGFVDELLGKLLEKYGFVAFSQLVSFTNVQGIVALLINHSIAQRMAAMHNEAGKSSR